MWNKQIFICIRHFVGVININCKYIYHYKLLYFSIHKNKRTYFYSSFIAYFLGLLATVIVMHYFKHAQVGS